MYNTCTNTNSTVVMNRVTGNIKDNNFINGYALGLTCTPNGSSCHGGNVIQGVKEWWYAVTITLPTRCTQWRFSVNGDHRGHLDNIYSSSLFHVESNLYTNNINNPRHNTSPYFLSSSYMQIATNQTTTYNLGAVDIDGDSLVYSVVNTKSRNSCNDTIANATYNTQTPTLQAPNNPLRCNNSFTINSKTGTATFTHANPITYSLSVVTFLVEEYRHGVLIGDVLRDVQFSAFPSSIAPPTISHDPNSLSGATFSNNRLNGCIGEQMSVCFDIESTGARFIASDNHQVILPGSQILYQNQMSDSVRGCLGWKPELRDTGLKTMIIDILDTTCSTTNGVLLNRQATFEVYVAPPVQANNDMIVCVNEQVQLNAAGGWGNYNWQVISGSQNSLSCTNCQSPIATPTVKTVYRVSSSNGICSGDGHYADTVVLDVHNATPTNPTINITATPGATVQKGTPVTFTANITACNNPEYQWLRNGSALGGATNNTWTSQLLNNQDRISCRLSCADTCPKPRIQESNIITMQFVSVAEVNKASTIKLYPNPNTGIFTIETELPEDKLPAQLTILNTFGQIVHKGNLTNSKQELQLNKLPAGMYFLKVVTDTGTHSLPFVVR